MTGTWRGLLREVGCDVEASVVSAAQLATAFLRIAARTKAEMSTDHRDAALSTTIASVGADVTALLAPRFVVAELLSRALVHSLCDRLDQVADLRLGVLAFVAAECLDVRCGRSFADSFRERSGERLRENDALPVIAFPLESLAPDEHRALMTALKPRTGDPARRADSVVRTRHLRLAPPEVESLSVRIRWADPWLEPIRATTRFGAAVTNHAALGDDVAWDPYQVGARAMFYAVRPRDLDGQRARIHAALDAARGAKIDVLVLPELCLTQSLFDELKASGAFADFPLVVAGSYHASVEARVAGANVCHVLAHGEPIAEHRKFADFYMGDCHEHLAREAEASGFELLLGASCSAVVLICKDVFGETGDLVQKLAPTLLLVPAMSEATEDFQLLAERLAHDPQAFTVVACAGPGDSAIFGRPSLKGKVITDRCDSGDCLVFSAWGGGRLW